jgi:hypothetical protein
MPRANISQTIDNRSNIVLVHETSVRQSEDRSCGVGCEDGLKIVSNDGHWYSHVYHWDSDTRALIR